MEKHGILAETLRENRLYKQLRISASRDLCDVYAIISKRTGTVEDLQYDSIEFSDINWDSTYSKEGL